MLAVHERAAGLPGREAVRAVFFDLDGTLIFQEPDSLDVMAAFCAEIGQPLTDEAWHSGRRARHAYFIDPAIRRTFGSLSSEQFWHHHHRHMLEVVGVSGDLDCLARELTVRNSALETVYCCPEASGHTLRELRARGYQLGLITNRVNLDRMLLHLDEMALRPYFDHVAAAGEVGISKPEPGIFCAALARAGVAAGEAVYVGDNYWADVVGAQRAGLVAVLLDPYRLFPEANCLVVEHIEDVLAWL